MPPFAKTILSVFSISTCLLLPLLNKGTGSGFINFFPSSLTILSSDTITKTDTTDKADLIYDSLQLDMYGLNKDVFSYAYAGYQKLENKGELNKEGLITICDFSQSSRKKRLYLIDLNAYKLLLHTYVAHGRNSGAEFAKKFSNKPESHQSSLGFYKTKKTYYGSHGLALTITGLEKGINDKAERRKIVIHGSDYIGANYLRFSRYMGRSFGCPAVPKKDSKKLINTIKNGSCLFIYHPNKTYLNGSTILNG